MPYKIEHWFRFWVVGLVKRFEFVFDERIRAGSNEHFHHFLLGYLLPSILEIEALRPSDDDLFYFNSCGPVMDVVLAEVCDALNLRYEILHKDMQDMAEHHIRIIPQRWDSALLNPHLKKAATPRFEKLRNKVMEYPDLVRFRLSDDLEPKLRHLLGKSKQVLTKVFDLETELIEQDAVGPLLLLKRSDAEEFYSEGGSARFSGYGVTRRSLQGLDKVAAELNAAGISAQVFEPGRHTLKEQIRAFHYCSGMIGIRGAEFANLVWVRPGAKVIMVTPDSMKKPSVQRFLGKVMQVEFSEVTVDSDHPDLSSALSVLATEVVHAG